MIPDPLGFAFHGSDRTGANCHGGWPSGVLEGDERRAPEGRKDPWRRAQGARCSSRGAGWPKTSRKSIDGMQMSVVLTRVPTATSAAPSE